MESMYCTNIIEQNTSSLTEENYIQNNVRKNRPRKNTRKNNANCENAADFFSSMLFKKMIRSTQTIPKDKLKTAIDDYKIKLEENNLPTVSLIKFDDQDLPEQTIPIIQNQNNKTKEQESGLENTIKEFEKNYSKFLDYLKKYKNIDDFINIKIHLKLLSKVYKVINDFGEERGSFEVNAYRFWTKFENDFFTNEEREILVSYGGLKQFYAKYLFQFERYNYFLYHKDQSVQDRLNTILEMDYKYLVDPVVFIPPLSREDFSPENCDKFLNHQAVLIEQGVDILEIDPKPFRLSRIEELYGNQLVDIVIQDPQLYGITKDESKLDQFKCQMKIKDYIDYQRSFLFEGLPRKYEEEDKYKIRFAVNVDVDRWEEVLEELAKKIPSKLMFCSDYDMLKYLKQDIKGVTIPQVYLKVPGSWTGGHEENLRVRAVNLNHGPMDCDWYTVDTEDVAQLRKVLIDKHNIDIHKEEGLWFLDLDFLIENKIPVSYFVQRPGEIVLLGPGCFHWVRSKGVTLNSAWNYCTKDLYQFQRTFERYDINKCVGFDSIIPIHSLILNIWEKEKLDNDLAEFFKKRLFMHYQDELLEYETLTNEEKLKFVTENKENIVLMCNKCYYETVFHYIYCPRCRKIEKRTILYCLKCYKEHKVNCKNLDYVEFYNKESLARTLNLIGITDSPFLQSFEMNKETETEDSDKMDVEPNISKSDPDVVKEKDKKKASKSKPIIQRAHPMFKRYDSDIYGEFVDEYQIKKKIKTETITPMNQSDANNDRSELSGNSPPEKETSIKGMEVKDTSSKDTENKDGASKDESINIPQNKESPAIEAPNVKNQTINKDNESNKIPLLLKSDKKAPFPLIVNNFNSSSMFFSKPKNEIM